MFPFNQFSQDMINHLLPGQRAYQDLLLDVAGTYEKEAVSASGACALTTLITELTVSGTKAYTLAAPTFAGQMKTVRCVSAASTPVGTLTVSSPDDTTGFVCASTFIFDTVGQEVTFRATAALKWRAVQVKRAGGTADNVVVGTTVLTGYNLWERYCLSVTGTVSSTGTKSIPNGSAVGEECIVTCSTAASTPIGNINATLQGLTGVAYTDLGAIGVAASTTVTGDMAALRWNGTAWALKYQTGCTLS